MSYGDASLCPDGQARQTEVRYSDRLTILVSIPHKRHLALGNHKAGGINWTENSRQARME